MIEKDKLNDQERAVLDRIAADPFAGQQEIADSLGLARPTVATYIAHLTRKGYLFGRAYVLAEANRIVCVGGATVDRKYRACEPLQQGTSNPVTSRRSFGGVARNVAETLARLGAPSSLISVVGDDGSGHSLVRHLQSCGVDTTRVLMVSGYATAEYAAILNADNELALGIADMEIFDSVTIDDMQRFWPAMAGASWVFADCNLPPAVLTWLRERRVGARFRLAVDAVSAVKVMHLQADLTGIDVLFLNMQEAVALVGESTAPTPRALTAALLARGAGSVVLTNGAGGLVVASGAKLINLAGVKANVVDVTGAGDALIAGTLARLLHGEQLPEACQTGMIAAVLAVESDESVNSSISEQLIERNLHRLPAAPKSQKKAS
ncbi:MAG: winged helix-turn-helix transcriptional regulator [Caulobacteraceae bacterium]|nr:winged helix-turn-helix transcriptional regulator [Caulobacteraceae bacterium]